MCSGCSLIQLVHLFLPSPVCASSVLCVYAVSGSTTGPESCLLSGGWITRVSHSTKRQFALQMVGVYKILSISGKHPHPCHPTSKFRLFSTYFSTLRKKDNVFVECFPKTVRICLRNTVKYLTKSANQKMYYLEGSWIEFKTKFSCFDFVCPSRAFLPTLTIY